MTREEILEAIANDKMMPFIQPEQLAGIVDFVIKNYNPFLSSNLEGAATAYGIQVSDGHNYRDLRVGFIAGAKYQRKQDQQLIEFAEDHAMLAGRIQMKEEMMEKAVDGKVIKSYNPVTAIGQPTLHGIELIYPDKGKPYLVAGDKVKIIVIPKENLNAIQNEN